MVKTHVEPQATEDRRVALLLTFENFISFLWSESVDHRNMSAFGVKTYSVHFDGEYEGKSV